MALELLKPVIYSTTTNGNPFQKIDPTTQALDVDVFRTQMVDVAAISTGNVSLSAPGTIGNVVPVNGALYLLAAQSDPTQNLFYNYDGTGDVLVENEWLSQQMAANHIGLVYALPTPGATLATNFFKLTTLSPVVGTDNITWENLSDDIAVVASGITLTGVVGTATTVAAGDVIAVTSDGDVVLARAGASDAGIYLASGIAISGGTTGDTIQYISRGRVIGSFAFSTPYQRNLWLSATTAGDFTLTAPTTTGQHQTLVGRTVGTNEIYVLADEQTSAVA